MTLIAPTIKRCAICRKWKFGFTLESTNSHGIDLDTRPRGMARGTLGYRIDQCSRCGYCAPAISQKLADNLIQILSSELYQKQLKDKNYPKLARQFLCWGILQRIAHNYDKLLWACIHAAWASDDRNAHEAAKQCRQKAITILSDEAITDQQLFPAGYDFVDVDGWKNSTLLESIHSGNYELKDENLDPIDLQGWDDNEILAAIHSQKAMLCEGYSINSIGTRELLLSELLRRTEQFEACVKISQVGISKEPRADIRQLLLAEQELAEKRDSDVHAAEKYISGG